MTDQEYPEKLVGLINHNGGWFVICSDVPIEMGAQFESEIVPGARAVVFGVATEDDIARERRFTGVQPPFKRYRYYYKAMVD